MNKTSLFLAALCSCTLLLSACGADDTTGNSSGSAADAGSTADSGAGGADAGAPKPPPNTAPSADSKKLWDLMKDYSKWPEFEETKGFPQSKSHQNMFVRAYYNTVVADFIKTGKKAPLPEGSIIVKANFKAKDAAKPAALTVMQKLKDGKWYWLKALANGNVFLAPDGKTPLEGTGVKGCIACHTSLAPKGNDLVAVHTFGK